MTRAELLAVLAALAVAAAVTDLAAAWLARVAARGEGTARTRRPSRLTGLAAALARLARRTGVRLPPARDLERRIAAAGLPARVRPADVAAAKGGAALVAAALAVPLATSAPGRLGPVLLLAAPAAGFLAPDLALRRRATRRGARMAAELPDVLDLLRVAVAAGLPLTRAFREVGRRHGGPLARELARAAAHTELGVPRQDVLDRLTDRCPVAGFAQVRAAIDRSDRHGTPLDRPLADLAASARAERARAIQDHAAKAAPKIQLVVALLLVPAVMLLLGAALVSQLL